MAIPAATPHRFTLKDYRRMAEVGVLRDDDRVELVEGEIVEISPIGGRHALCVTALNDIFHRNGVDAVIRVQCPLQLSAVTQLQPDLALLKPPHQRYKPDRIPRPDDVLLIIEVADSSFLYDRDTKARLYAQAGIAEYWLVDLTQSTLCGCTRAPRGRALRLGEPDARWRDGSADGIPELCNPGQ